MLRRVLTDRFRFRSVPFDSFWCRPWMVPLVHFVTTNPVSPLESRSDLQFLCCRRHHRRSQTEQRIGSIRWRLAASSLSRTKRKASLPRGDQFPVRRRASRSHGRPNRNGGQNKTVSAERIGSPTETRDPSPAFAPAHGARFVGFADRSHPQPSEADEKPSATRPCRENNRIHLAQITPRSCPGTTFYGATEPTERNAATPATLPLEGRGRGTDGAPWRNTPHDSAPPKARNSPVDGTLVHRSRSSFFEALLSFSPNIFHNPILVLFMVCYQSTFLRVFAVFDGDTAAFSEWKRIESNRIESNRIIPWQNRKYTQTVCCGRQLYRWQYQQNPNNTIRNTTNICGY